jgi:hypothetical protein
MYNLNLSILSLEDPFTKRVLFWVLLLEKTKKMGIEPFACNATQTWNMSCILDNSCWRQSKEYYYSALFKYLVSAICHLPFFTLTCLMSHT